MVLHQNTWVCIKIRGFASTYTGFTLNYMGFTPQYDAWFRIKIHYFKLQYIGVLTNAFFYTKIHDFHENLYLFIEFKQKHWKLNISHFPISKIQQLLYYRTAIFFKIWQCNNIAVATFNISLSLGSNCYIIAQQYFNNIAVQ